MSGVFNFGGAGTSKGNDFANADILSKIEIDSFGQLYYKNGYDLDALKAGTVLCLLGSLNDESGYSNIVTASPGQQNPPQVLSLDGKPSLGLLTNTTELSVPSIPSLLANSTGATLYAVYSSSNPSGVQELIRTSSPNNTDGWWRFVNGDGYFSVFRQTRLENYPANLPLTGNFLVSVHSRIGDYEIFINAQTRGVVNGNWFGGDTFIICPTGKWNTCNLSLLLVVPFWVSGNSLFHQQKLQAIKGRFPSLPFTL